MVVGSKVGMLLLGILISYSMLQIVVMIKDYTQFLLNIVCTTLSVMVIALYGYEEFLLLSNFTGARKLFIILDYEFVAVTCLLVISYVSMLLTLAQQQGIYKEKALLQCLFFIVILSYVLNCALGFFLFGRPGISHNWVQIGTFTWLLLA